MRKRYYIFIVTHDWDGQLRRMPIPVQWVVVFVICAVVGAGTLAGLAGSYGRMLTKVRNFDELRNSQAVLVHQLQNARKDAAESRVEVASLGSLASEISTIYNFRHNADLKSRLQAVTDVDNPNGDDADATDDDDVNLFNATLNNFQVLETTAMSASLPDQWSPFGHGSVTPDMWPVRGRITSGFGERLDPFDGEGSFHTGIDIAVPYGTPVHATADGLVVFAGTMNGYGRTVIVEHSQSVRTLYAHMSALSVSVGERIERDDVVGRVGLSGRTTGPHLHYEVRIGGTPVNPYRFLRP